MNTVHRVGQHGKLHSLQWLTGPSYNIPRSIMTTLSQFTNLLTCFTISPLWLLFLYFSLFSLFLINSIRISTFGFHARLRKRNSCVRIFMYRYSYQHMLNMILPVIIVMFLVYSGLNSIIHGDSSLLLRMTNIIQDYSTRTLPNQRWQML